MNDRAARLSFWALMTATILTALWSLFIYQMYAFGAADFLYGDFRHELAEEIGLQRANHFTALASRHVHYSVQQAVAFVGLPLVVTNLAWAWYIRQLIK